MNKLLLLIAFLMILSSSIAQVPSSARSADAVDRQQKKLQHKADSMGLKLGNPVFIRIFKESKELEIWIKTENQFTLFKIYPVCYYSGTLGTKTIIRDNQAPEGFYEIKPKSMNPSSSFHLSFNIGYPNALERSKYYTGSEIMVHGDCVSVGCYAMGDENIEEIWTLIVKAFEKGQKVISLQIFPFRMTDQNMKSHQDTKWNEFWANLKEGYDYFEIHKTPPVVSACQQKYCFR
ncbi:MAG: murein L,D-transpeptidase [Bacteroidetes bacterium]|nr:murein L,D-transpeptidase [Bacteroidota bacterium]